MKKKILIVDDEEKIRNTTSEVLRCEGYTVKNAKSIATAKKTLKSWSPDLLILDILLPSGNLKTFIRELDNYKTPKILYLSALPQEKAELFGFLNISKKVIDYVENPTLFQNSSR